jgi:3-hydroxyacyl-CoA dehydrogenase
MTHKEPAMGSTRYEVRGACALIHLDNPPINGLGAALREGIMQSLDRALADTGVRAIIVTGSARAFSGGADVKEFNTPNSLREPRLPALIAAFENSPKPVIAAIAGVCMGGGLELALGAHFRVAKSDAQIALPEVKLGLLPGAGGTQRLPRVIGLEAALNMIVSGATVPAAKLNGTALFDDVVDGDPVDAAVALADKVIAEKRPLKRVRDLKVSDRQAEAFVQFARNTVGATAKGFPAPLKCVEAVSWSLTKPIDEALRMERESFLSLMTTPESRALRHIFAAERAASKIVDVPDDTPLRPIKRVGIIGAGTMGGGIAMNFANAGIPVAILEMKQEALDKGLGTIRKNYDNTAKKGRITEAQVGERMALITPTLGYDAMKDADLVIEAVFENMDVKQQVFKTLDEVCKPGAILASNTSALNLNTIAGFTKRPQDVIGLHFFSPANVMRLLEIVRGDKTAPDVLATCMAMARTIKKIGVVSGVCDGFIGNRMLAKYGAAANGLLMAGALPQQVDKALEKFGFAMGPFRVGDLAGLDIGWAGRKRRQAENPAAYQRVVADSICEQGRYGQKTGAGWYRYEPGARDPIPDPLVADIIEQFRQSRGIDARKVSDDEVVERCVFALVNEGARILDEKIAARASDIDVVYLNGYGFPQIRGGPMLYADIVGLPNVVRSLRRFAAEPGAEAWWQPAPLLQRLADDGKTFN